MEVGELGPESHAGMGQRNRRFCGILQSASLLERNTVVSADAPLLVLGNGKWQQTMWFVECCRCDGGFILAAYNHSSFFGLPSSLSPPPLLDFHVYTH
ncbi:hypothetical protein V6N13_018505 [Hibiscus sabdariffa]